MKDRINARRRELRKIKRAERLQVLQGKNCLLCELRLDKHGRNIKSAYCLDCCKRFRREVNIDKCKRYYAKNSKLRVAGNFR